LHAVIPGAVTLGIRPEHIHTQQPRDTHAVAPIKAHVEVVEPVGNEVFIYFTTGTNAHYVARAATDRPPDVGKTFELLIDTAKVHFFDKTSEQAL
jgi:multiple sugar transport system ATP-binding protein